MYYTYMLRCKDNSVYTGITNDLNKRMEQHFTQDKNGAKYTKSHHAQKVEKVWRSKEKALACKLEYYLKRLTKQEKEKIINGEPLKSFLKGKIDSRRYSNIELSKVLDKKYISCGGEK